MSASISSTVAPLSARKSKIAKLNKPTIAPIAADTIVFLDPASIAVTQGYNVRTLDASAKGTKEADYNEDRRLIESIAKRGVTEPLTVRQAADGIPHLVAGHRRLAAVMSLVEYGHKPRTTVPVRLAINVESDAGLDGDLFLSNSGKPLTPMQQAVVATRLATVHKWTKQEIATAGLFTTRYVSDLLLLATIPSELQTLVFAENVSSTNVIELIKRFDAPTVATMVRKALTAEQAKVAFGDKVKVTLKHVTKHNAELFNPPAAPVETAPVECATVETAPVTDAAPVEGATVETAPVEGAKKGATLPGSKAEPAKLADVAKSPAKGGGTVLRAMGAQLFTTSNERIATFQSKARAEAVAAVWNASGMTLPALASEAPTSAK